MTALAGAVAADKSSLGPAIHYGYGYGYKPFSYGYSVHQPYQQKTHVHHYQHGLQYGSGYPYGHGHHYGSPYRYGHQYDSLYRYGHEYGYGHGLPAYSHVRYSGYPSNYALHVAHPKARPHKYAGSPYSYAYRPARFGYSTTVVHPAGAPVLRPAGGYAKPAVLYAKPEEEGDAMADEETSSGDEMPAEEMVADAPTVEGSQ